MMTKKQKEKLEADFKKASTPFDKEMKDLTLEIHDVKQVLVHSKYNHEYLKLRLEGLERIKQEMANKIKVYYNENSKK